MGHLELVRKLLLAGANPILSFRKSNSLCSQAEEMQVATSAGSMKAPRAVLEAMASLFLHISFPCSVMERVFAYALISNKYSKEQIFHFTHLYLTRSCVQRKQRISKVWS